MRDSRAERSGGGGPVKEVGFHSFIYLTCERGVILQRELS
jgi:hypothetical protein